MKWHDYKIQVFEFARVLGIPSKDHELMFRMICANLERIGGNPGAIGNSKAHLAGELRWIDARKPYYNVWPNVMEAFTKIDLDKVACLDVKLPLSQLMVRFQEGHELAGKVKAILAMQMETKTGPHLILSIHDGSILEGDNFTMPAPTLISVGLTEGETIGDRLRYGRAKPYCMDKIDEAMVDECVRLVVTLCLLQGNPDLVEQAPLEADREKWEATHDIKYIEKAERRGKREWNVGAKIEIEPGFRRPHFAIRWMGKGRTTPTVRPVKGCLVRRGKVLEIPSGTLD